jgi:hypothetical protein
VINPVWGNRGLLSYHRISTLPRSGFVQQEIKQGQKTVGFLFTPFTYFSQQIFAA